VETDADNIQIYSESHTVTKLMNYCQRHTLKGK